MRFAAAKTGLIFEPMNFSGAGGQGIGAAGGMSTLGKTFGAIRNKAPKYGNIGRTSIAAQNSMWRAGQTAKASVHATGMGIAGRVQSAKLIADAKVSAANKQKQGATMGGILGVVGSIGGALLSDERTKTDIKDLNSALELLRELKPVTFHYNEEYSCNPERMHYGFIAQEYQEVMPDQTYYDPSIERYCIDTNELIAVLVRGIQELNTKVTRLEAKAALVMS